MLVGATIVVGRSEPCVRQGRLRGAPHETEALLEHGLTVVRHWHLRSRSRARPVPVAGLDLEPGGVAAIAVKPFAERMARRTWLPHRGQSVSAEADSDGVTSSNR